MFVMFCLLRGGGGAGWTGTPNGWGGDLPNRTDFSMALRLLGDLRRQQPPDESNERIWESGELREVDFLEGELSRAKIKKTSGWS